MTALIPDQTFYGFNGFASLVQVLGTATGTNDKLDALARYFVSADDKDKVWVIALFSGRRPRRIASTTLLQQWSNELSGTPAWLFEECYHTVGDLAETIALLLPPVATTIQAARDNVVGGAARGVGDGGGARDDHGDGSGDGGVAGSGEEDYSLSYYLEQLVALEKQDDAVKKSFVVHHWRRMNKDERFVFNKLLTGGFRIGVSQKMMVNALAKKITLSASVIAHRISGNWDPSTTSFQELLLEQEAPIDFSRPYPFYLAYALDQEPQQLGAPEEWQAEWKWDGIRGQIIKRNNELFVWSRGEELMTEKFPEYHQLVSLLPEGVVLDGEIIPSTDGKPMPFAMLQTRIGRKNITKKNLTEAPIAFFAYDLLEHDGIDIREQPLDTRRQLLEQIVAAAGHPTLQLSPIISFTSWLELAEIRGQSRAQQVEGLMLKRRSAPYQVGRKVGDWWKWKIDPLTIDAVMIYAQKGHGRRSNLYTDYTFAVKDGDRLVSFTKAYSGLTDKEFAEVDAFVKRHSIEKFGPVRTVKPELVFEIAFEGIAASNRHKSGVALRFPRISRWRKDKKADEINTLEDLKKMLERHGA